MKKYAPILMIFICLCMCGCSANQDNQKQSCKTAIAAHMSDIHGLSINDYENIHVYDDNSVSATVEVTVAIENGLGSMEMSVDLRLDENHEIDSCSLCDLGVGYNGGAQVIEESTVIYRDFILRKTEQLTGFVISVEMDNYEEHEITESGQTYIDIFAFINIEEMVGTPINSDSVFQLYALVNPDNEEDLFIAITGNSTGEIYRYDHTSIPHETTDNDSSINSTNTFSEQSDEFTRFYGRAVVSNGWIYYLGGGGLCRMKTDGSNKQLMSEDNVLNIEVDGDWVYYNNINTLYRIRTDGSSRQTVYKYVKYFTVEQDWIYCSDSDEIFRIKADGSDKEEILDWGSEQVVVVGDWLYFGSLYRIQTDGTNLEEFEYTDTTIGPCCDMVAVDDWIYSVNGGSYGIKRIKIDGSEVQRLTDNRVCTYAIVDDWIYYSNVDDGVAPRLYRMKKDGTENQMLFDERVEYFCIDGDWIYYWNWNSTDWEFSDLFRIKMDGSQKQSICES